MNLTARRLLTFTTRSLYGPAKVLYCCSATTAPTTYQTLEQARRAAAFGHHGTVLLIAPYSTIAPAKVVAAQWAGTVLPMLCDIARDVASAPTSSS